MRFQCTCIHIPQIHIYMPNACAQSLQMIYIKSEKTEETMTPRCDNRDLAPPTSGVAISSDSLDYMIRDIMLPIIPGDVEGEIVNLIQQKLARRMTVFEHLLGGGNRCAICAFMEADLSGRGGERLTGPCEHSQSTYIPTDIYVPELDNQIGSVELFRMRARDTKPSAEMSINEAIAGSGMRKPSRTVAYENTLLCHQSSVDDYRHRILRRAHAGLDDKERQSAQISIGSLEVKSKNPATRRCSLGQALILGDSGLDLEGRGDCKSSQVTSKPSRHPNFQRVSFLKSVLRKVGLSTKVDGNQVNHARRSSVPGGILCRQ